MKSKISEGNRATLANEIATSTEATAADLKSRWCVLYGAEPPPRISRDLLTRAIAYRIQEDALGGLKPSTRRLLAKVAANASARRPIQVTSAPTLTPGTILLRDWRGTQHQVIVREHGVEFQGKRYKSLSQVAHRITGKSGGCSFSRGALYELLANPIHIGEIRHKHERYPGQHEATVPRELWERVQQRLRVNAARGRQSSTSAIASPLAGKIFDADGEPLYAQGAAKAGRRYRYYVSRSLVTGSSSDERKSWRLAAPELERAVALRRNTSSAIAPGCWRSLRGRRSNRPILEPLSNRSPLFAADWKTKPIPGTAWSSSSTGSNGATTAYGRHSRSGFPVRARECRPAAFLICPASCHSR